MPDLHQPRRNDDKVEFVILGLLIAAAGLLLFQGYFNQGQVARALAELEDKVVNIDIESYVPASATFRAKDPISGEDIEFKILSNPKKDYDPAAFGKRAYDNWVVFKDSLRKK